MGQNYLKSFSFIEDDINFMRLHDTRNAKCRDITKQVTYDGECLKCGAWEGEICREVKFKDA